MKKTKSNQGLRIKGIKYQILRESIDENSSGYTVFGKRVSYVFYFATFFYLFGVCI